MGQQKARQSVSPERVTRLLAKLFVTHTRTVDKVGGGRAHLSLRLPWSKGRGRGKKTGQTGSPSRLPAAPPFCPLPLTVAPMTF